MIDMMKSSFSLRTKLLLLAVLPLLLLSIVIGVISLQVGWISENQQKTVQEILIDYQEQRLRSYLRLVESTIDDVLSEYDLPTKELTAQEAVKNKLRQFMYSDDGYFFVYDMKGINLVHPILKDFEGKNKHDLQDSNGKYVIRELLLKTKNGGGIVSYLWYRPSTGKEEEKLSYVETLTPWNWMVGTGLYDVTPQVNKNLKKIQDNINQGFIIILLLMAGTIVLILGIVLFTNLHESRLADQRLQRLVHNFVQMQVEERRSFARELHDGISQLMVAVKFRIELALRQANKGNPQYRDSLSDALTTLDESIREVRHISHSLRPDLLDEMGFEIALDSLIEQFSERTGILVKKSIALQPASLPDDIAIMLYRVIQEALTNIERHAQATQLRLDIQQNVADIHLDLADNGQGFNFEPSSGGQGIGVKNMRERVELLGGQFKLSTRPGHGTHIQATLPLQDFSEA